MSTLELKLSDTVSIFTEVEDTGSGRRQDVSNNKGKLEEKFEKVTGSLSAIAEAMEAQLAKIPRPDKVELEMGAELKGGADLWIVSGETKGHMKIKMVWDKPKADA